MVPQNQLPPTDPDLMLALELGEHLESNTAFSEMSDSLITPLLAYKQSHSVTENLTAVPSDRIWKQILIQTTPKHAPITTLFPKYLLTWATAATVLIAVFLGMYWFVQQPIIEVVAESGNEIEVVQLEDGSTVTLRPNSMLRRKSTRKKTFSKKRSYELSGEAYFEVTNDPEKPFSVQAGDGIVTVLGTTFTVSTWGNETKVYLEEGRVRFSDELNSESVTMEPGQSSRLSSGVISIADSTSALPFIDWLSGTLVFDQTSPIEILEELTQHYNVQFISTELDQQSTLSGTLTLGTLAQTLEDLGLVLGGTFRQLSEKEYVFIALE